MAGSSLSQAGVRVPKAVHVHRALCVLRDRSLMRLPALSLHFLPLCSGHKEKAQLPGLQQRAGWEGAAPSRSGSAAVCRLHLLGLFAIETAALQGNEPGDHSEH